ncbi:MAG: tetratricopeptide repeat protein [Bacteroidales bacterium]|nr:tetratricopeptide repeat protein [Bacteroidales bacterium]
MQEDYDDAIRNHQKSLWIAREINDSVMIGKNYFNTGINYIGKNQPDTALQFLEKALAIYRSLGIDTYQVLNLKGQAYNKRGDYKKAIKVFDQVISAKDSTTAWEISYAHTGTAVAYQKQGATIRSTIHALKALEIAKEMNTKWDIQRITKILADNYAANEQWQRAYHYLSLHKKYSDSVFNEKKESQINYLRLKRKEVENKNLERDNKLKAMVLKKRTAPNVSRGGVTSDR